VFEMQESWLEKQVMVVSSSKKKVMLIRINYNDQNLYALKWTLNHFFLTLIFRLVLVHAKFNPSSSCFVGHGTYLLLLSSIFFLSSIQNPFFGVCWFLWMTTILNYGMR